MCVCVDGYTCTNWQNYRLNIFVAANSFNFNFLRAQTQWSYSFSFRFFTSLVRTKQYELKLVRHVNIFVIELNWYSQPMHLNQFSGNQLKTSFSSFVVFKCNVHMNTKHVSNWIFCRFYHPFIWDCSLEILPFANHFILKNIYIFPLYLFEQMKLFPVLDPKQKKSMHPTSLHQDEIHLNNFQIRLCLT